MKGEWITTTGIAKMIRVDLAAAWPKVKFSVRTQYYSGGSSVNIRWTDGPTQKRVEAEIGQYEGKGFDGMTDCSYYLRHYRLPNGKIIYGGHDACGMAAADHVDPPPGAVEVHLSGCYINCSRYLSTRFMQTIADVVCQENKWEPFTFDNADEGMFEWNWPESVPEFVCDAVERAARDTEDLG